MKKFVPKTLFFLLTLMISHSVIAQSLYPILRGWYNIDSAYLDFNSNSPFYKNSGYHYISIDTTGAKLWQLGKSNKTFGNALSPSKTLITDTLNPPDTSSNDSLVVTLGFNYNINPIFYFEHRYLTDSTQDGGIIEYSLDKGASWHLLYDSCNADNQPL